MFQNVCVFGPTMKMYISVINAISNSELSSWQNCKAWYSLFHLPFTPASSGRPSYPFSYFSFPFPSFLSRPISFTSLFAKRPLQIQLGDFGEHCKLLQRVRGSRVRPLTHFWDIVSSGNAFGDSNFALFSSTEEVKISNVGTIGRPVGTWHDCSSQMREISSRQRENVRRNSNAWVRIRMRETFW